MGQLSAGITHELNQPLAAIRAYADNARVFLERGLTGKVDENLKLVSELTDVSKVSDGNRAVRKAIDRNAEKCRRASEQLRNALVLHDDRPALWDAWDVDPSILETGHDCQPAATCHIQAPSRQDGPAKFANHRDFRNLAARPSGRRPGRECAGLHHPFSRPADQARLAPAWVGEAWVQALAEAWVRRERGPPGQLSRRSSWDFPPQKTLPNQRRSRHWKI